ncbi:MULTISPECIES: MBL fold metallo-hydrolase [unclassified Streptococcus]|uniref:MBL fold metallo-hydrolase n=1 Tax=unclassified Streptococcus TaxID=2608887 RepID=UPI001071B922|nr:MULTISPECIES: MBL fold metallo-hydrolase [unclassified Streptococcus]MBF0787658.1 MBL fold metallo-hydrolase [Streptococcus sp. 19428wC2_LYSM12]MCQ9212231.1 MBL fold metallo-hydrolase [Streptococcus sp. B01]MCQ9213562.1 MBL fold metallo-hydrolase [Streptococcus sp. O1]TFV05380.1 MBL fold metallo-hydrolase [Streptococcus sp. LYSM12]
MKLHKTVNPVAHENTYYLENTSHIIVVDPGSDWEAIRQMIERLGKPIAAILLTHTHYDHIMSLDLVRDHFGAPPVYVAASEASWLYTPEMNLSGLARHDDMDNIVCRPAEQIFQYDKEYHIDGFIFSVVETPGHSIGGVSFIFKEQELVITGDALFREAIGRTDLPTSNFEHLLTSIQTQLFTLPSHYQVYPGHGASTTISHEKAFNPFFS